MHKHYMTAFIDTILDLTPLLWFEADFKLAYFRLEGFGEISHCSDDLILGAHGN